MLFWKNICNMNLYKSKHNKVFSILIFKELYVYSKTREKQKDDQVRITFVERGYNSIEFYRECQIHS